MSCDEFIKGHLFSFDTGTCRRCAMQRTRFEALGEPECRVRTSEEPDAPPEPRPRDLRG